jgi:hypothetical protein
MYHKNEMNHGHDPKRSYFVALCLDDISRLRIQRNDLESVLFTFQSAADIWEHFVNIHPLQLSYVLDTIGWIHCQQRNLKISLLFHDDAYKIKVRAVGKHHISLISNCRIWGRAYMADGKYDSHQLLHRRR